MVKKCDGNEAPYKPDFLGNTIPTTYCVGETGSLSSTSFNSCVGMVLWCGKPKGVVAHFPGSAPTPGKDTTAILADVLPLSVDSWQAWVFGGISLQTGNDSGEAQKEKTKKIIDKIRSTLKAYKDESGLQVFNVPLPKEGGLTSALLGSAPKGPESLDSTTYAGHKGVTLDVKTGKLTWDEGAAKPKVTVDI